MSNQTCYLDRSKVREIITCVADEHVHVTEGILSDIDQLPIATISSDALAASERDALRSAMEQIIAVCDDNADVDNAALALTFIRDVAGRALGG